MQLRVFVVKGVGLNDSVLVSFTHELIAVFAHSDPLNYNLTYRTSHLGVGILCQGMPRHQFYLLIALSLSPICKVVTYCSSWSTSDLLRQPQTDRLHYSKAGYLVQVFQARLGIPVEILSTQFKK